MVLRCEDGVVCALCRTHEKATNLVGEFEQKALDSGVSLDYYVAGQLFYDE